MHNINEAVFHISQTINRQMLTTPAAPFRPEPINAIIDRLNARMSANAARTIATRAMDY